MTIHAVIYSAMAIALACVCLAEWSVVRMRREISRLELPGGERLIRGRMSVWWLPGYTQRHILRVYKSLQPYSRLRWLYPGSLVAAGLVILAAVLVSAHAAGGVQ